MGTDVPQESFETLLSKLKYLLSYNNAFKNWEATEKYAEVTDKVNALVSFAADEPFDISILDLDRLTYILDGAYSSARCLEDPVWDQLHELIHVGLQKLATKVSTAFKSGTDQLRDLHLLSYIKTNTATNDSPQPVKEACSKCLSNVNIAIADHKLSLNSLPAQAWIRENPNPSEILIRGACNWVKIGNSDQAAFSKTIARALYVTQSRQQVAEIFHELRDVLMPDDQEAAEIIITETFAMYDTEDYEPEPTQRLETVETDAVVVHDSQSRIECLEFDKDRLEEALKAKDITQKELQEQLKDLQHEMDSTLLQCEKAEANIAKLKSSLTAEEEAHTELKQCFDNLEREKSSATQQIKTLLEAKSVLEASLSMQQGTSEGFLERISKLQSGLADTDATIEALGIDNDEYEESLAMEKAAHQGLRDLFDNLQSEKNALENARATLDCEVAELSSALRYQKAACKQSQAEKTSLEDALTAKEDDHTMKLAALGKSFKAEKDEMVKTLEFMELKHDVYDIQRRSCEAALEQRDESKAEIGRVRAESREHENRANDLELELHLLLSKLQERETELLAETIKTLSANLNSCVSETEKLQLSITKLREAKSQLETSNASLRTELEAVNKVADMGFPSSDAGLENTERTISTELNGDDTGSDAESWVDVAEADNKCADAAKGGDQSALLHP